MAPPRGTELPRECYDVSSFLVLNESTCIMGRWIDREAGGVIMQKLWKMFHLNYSSYFPQFIFMQASKISTCKPSTLLASDLPWVGFIVPVPSPCLPWRKAQLELCCLSLPPMLIASKIIHIPKATCCVLVLAQSPSASLNHFPLSIASKIHPTSLPGA